MAGKTAILAIKILSDSKAAKADMESTAGGLDKLEKGANKMAPAAGIALGAITLFAKGAITAAEGVAVADNRIGAITNSMGLFGDRAGAVSAQVIKDANTLGSKIGVDPQVIKQGQAALLTFAEVGKSAGQAGGMFDRATRASTDLAAAGFGSVESASVMLGKALNDPIAGMSALSRVGVGFTAEQKNMITTLQESGDILGAQNIVMGNVEKQVGGTAEATATASGKMKVALDGIGETIGATLLPYVGQLAEAVIGLSGFIADNSDVVVIAGGTVAALAGGVLLISGAFKVWQAMTIAYTAAQWLMNAALAANPIGLVVVAVGLLVAALVLAYNNVGWFRDAVDRMGKFVGDIFNWIGDRIAGAVSGFKDLLGWLGIVKRDSAGISAPAQAQPAQAMMAGPMLMAAPAGDGAPQMRMMSFAAPLAAPAPAPAPGRAGAIAGRDGQPAQPVYYVDVTVQAAYDKRGVAQEIRDMLNSLDRTNGKTVVTGGGRW